MTAASDQGAAWHFPIPVLSPAGNPVPGQTLTAQVNGALPSETPFLGALLAVGNRVLIREVVGGGTFGGVWVIVALGDATHPWQLVRATDCDTMAELPNGTTVVSQHTVDTGVAYGIALCQYLAGTWTYLPNVIDLLTILQSLQVGTGAVSPALTVTGGVSTDALTVGLTGTRTPTVNNGGTATYSTRSCRWVKIGQLVVFTIVVTVSANGSGATAVTITATGLPVPLANAVVVGDRATVGVNRILGRLTSGAGEGQITGLFLWATPVTALTGADLLNTATYQLSGSYLSV